MAERSASELARETLRQLALNRLPPTPENYTRLYEQAAGEPGPASFPQGRCATSMRFCLRRRPDRSACATSWAPP